MSKFNVILGTITVQLLLLWAGTCYADADLQPYKAVGTQEAWMCTRAIMLGAGPVRDACIKLEQTKVILLPARLVAGNLNIA
jgi:hypothetical protein